ncbi:MAG: helix-turn-helix domain-containing protein [Opitutaceae bacterium]|nr:helix-turn-helix domain-containing protein [Opitutaceae bacterium]
MHAALMFTEKLKELEATRAKLAILEQAIANERKTELAGLPAKFGFASPAEFIAAFRAATGGGREPRSGARRARSVITDEIRGRVKELVGAGKTAGEIAEAVDISVASVQNIKKALGLVKG